MLVRYEGKLYLISEDESNGMNMNTLMEKGGNCKARLLFPLQTAIAMFNLEFVTGDAVSATSSIFRLVDSVYHARPAMPPLTALCIFMFIPLDVTYDIRYSFPSYLTNIKRVGVDNRYRTGRG